MKRNSPLLTTAIAAVFAIAASPLAAQDTAAEPVVDAPTSTEPSATVDPLAPQPADSESPAATVTSSPEREAAASPAASKARSTPARRPTAARNATTAPAPATAATAPATMPVMEAEAAPPVAPIPAAEPTTPATASSDTALERARMMDMALAIGAGLIALLAIGMLWMLRRRKRRREEEAWDEQNAWVEPAAEPAAEPAFTRPEPAPAFAAPVAAIAEPRHDPVRTAPKSTLPEGFDLSRFGPHVQAAYRGPTPDNPSLSLKYRLRKAAAMDQLARKAGEQQATPVTVAKPESKPELQPLRSAFVFRQANNKPAFQY